MPWCQGCIQCCEGGFENDQGSFRVLRVYFVLLRDRVPQDVKGNQEDTEKVITRLGRMAEIASQNNEARLEFVKLAPYVLSVTCDAMLCITSLICRDLDQIYVKMHKVSTQGIVRRVVFSAADKATIQECATELDKIIALLQYHLGVAAMSKLQNIRGRVENASMSQSLCSHYAAWMFNELYL